MRILITTNGTNEIQDLTPKATPAITSSEHDVQAQTQQQQQQRAHTYDHHNTSIQQSSSHYQDSSGSGMMDYKGKVSAVKISTKKISLPPTMLQKYNVDGSNTVASSSKQNDTSSLLDNNETSSNGLLPDVLMSIEKSMDMTSRNKLPNIRNSYPIKYIINPNSYSKLENELEAKKAKLKYKSKITNPTCFRSQVYPDPNEEFMSNANTEINAQNTNLIEYLNTDNTISNQYLSKLAKYDLDRMRKLNKICQKAFHYRSQEGIIKNFILQKIKGDLNYKNDYCKRKLKEMKDYLDMSSSIVNKSPPKFNKKDRYTFQYREAEKNWKKYNTQRYYRKSAPPQTNVGNTDLDIYAKTNNN